MTIFKKSTRKWKPKWKIGDTFKIRIYHYRICAISQEDKLYFFYEMPVHQTGRFASTIQVANEKAILEDIESSS